MPHCSTSIDLCDGVTCLGLDTVGIARLSVNANGLIVLRNVIVLHANAIKLKLLGFHLAFVISPTVHGQRLVNDKGAIHGADKQLLSWGQTFHSGQEDVDCGPGLGDKPQEDEPAVLLGNEVPEEVAPTGAVKVQVVREAVLEPADVLVSQPASRDEQDDGNGGTEKDRKGEGEDLDADLAGKLGEDVGQVGADHMGQQDPGRDHVLRADLDDLAEEAATMDVHKVNGMVNLEKKRKYI